MMKTVAIPDPRSENTAEHHDVPAVAELPNQKLLTIANELSYQRSLLTTRQRVFLEEYCANGMNGIMAAITASYPPTEAKKAATKLLELPAMKRAVELILEYHTEKAQVRIEDLVGELKNMAMSNMADFYGFDANGEPVLKIDTEDGMVDRDKMSAVQEIAITNSQWGRNVKFKLYDKKGAIETLLKMAGQKGLADKEGDTYNNNVVNNITITPVPSGKFIEAPVIEHQPLERMKVIGPKRDT